MTSWLGIKNIGFVEDQPTRWTSDLDILGTPADLPRLIDKYQVSHVFICLPMSRYHEARKVFDMLSQTLVEVRLIADVPDLAGLSLTTTNFDGMPMIGLRESPHFGFNIVVKRAMDMLLAAFALILLAPVMAVIAALRQADQPRSDLLSPGALRAQRRKLSDAQVPQHGRRRREADRGRLGRQERSAPDSPWARSCARPASTSCRSSSTCCVGDMSLVGPRPERPVFIKKFSKTIPNYKARHCVKAGITGWAQVHGWRGNTSLRKRIQYDLYYITHWTPLARHPHSVDDALARHRPSECILVCPACRAEPRARLIAFAILRNCGRG